MVDFRGIFLSSLVTVYLFEQYLRFRKGRANRQGFTAEVKARSVVTEEEYTKTLEYNEAKNNFGYVSDLVKMAACVVATFFAPAVWEAALSLAPWGNSYLTIVAFVVLSSGLEQLSSLPLSAYSTFVIEEKFGFNKYTIGEFAKDKVKGLLVLEWGIGGVMYCGLVAVMDWAGRDAWFYLWLFISGMVFTLNLLYPVAIAPLFNTFKPLSNETIKAGIDKLVGQTGLSCKKVFEVDGSKQSSHSNAYVAGFCGSKRIVVYDTLIKDLDESVEHINAVVGHEIGHSMLNHTWVLLGMTMLNFFVMFWSFGYVQNTDAVVTDFGFSVPVTFLRLHCFMQVYSGMINPLFTVFMNAVVRQLEFQADRYSATLGMDIGTALTTISKTNKGDLNPDWLHSLYHHNHPPLLERLDAVNAHLKTTKQE